MRRPRKTRAGRLLDGVKVLLVGTAAFVVVGSATAQDRAVTVDTGLPPVAVLAEVDDLMDAHDCSVTGFGPDVIPGSALVLYRGEVHVVSFDDGWAVYTGSRPGRLMALCRGTVDA